MATHLPILTQMIRVKCEVASAIADLPMLAEGDVRTSEAATFQYVGFGTNDVGEQFTT